MAMAPLPNKIPTMMLHASSARMSASSETIPTVIMRSHIPSDDDVTAASTSLARDRLTII